MATIKNLLQILLDAVFPVHCFGCGNRGEPLCEKCLDAVPQAKEVCFNCEASPAAGLCRGCAHVLKLANTAIFWATNFHHEPVRKLIHALKYRGARNAAKTLATLIHIKHRVFNMNTDTTKNTIIVPIPMHTSRLRERGVNHAELIASELAELLRLPLTKNILIKTRPTHSQVEARSRAARLKNLAKSFAINDSAALTGKTVILVDDVLTTGATATICSQTLRRAGAREVIVLVAAH